jgi:hypothetical protein
MVKLFTKEQERRVVDLGDKATTEAKDKTRPIIPLEQETTPGRSEETEMADAPTIEEDLVLNPAPISDLTVFTSGEHSTETLPEGLNFVQDTDPALKDVVTPLPSTAESSVPSDIKSSIVSDPVSVEQHANGERDKDPPTSEDASTSNVSETENADIQEPRANIERKIMGVPEALSTYLESSDDADDLNEKSTTPKKSGGKPREKSAEFAERHSSPSLAEHFEKSASDSDSSEASDGGWTEVHDESVSSDTGHSVQTSGTLGSAIIVDATTNARKNPTAASMAMKPMEEVTHSSSPKREAFPHSDSTSPKKTKSLKAKNKAVMEDETRVSKSPTKESSSDVKKKKMKGKRGVMDLDATPSPTLGASPSYNKDEKIFLSTKKKAKKIVVGDATGPDGKEISTPAAKEEKAKPKIRADGSRKDDKDAGPEGNAISTPAAKEKKSKEKIKIDGSRQGGKDAVTPAKSSSPTSAKKKKGKIQVQIDDSENSKPAPPTPSTPMTPLTSPPKKKKSSKKVASPHDKVITPRSPTSPSEVSPKKKKSSKKPVMEEAVVKSPPPPSKSSEDENMMSGKRKKKKKADKDE